MEDVVLGEMAHIVGQGEDGPRRDKPIPGGEIDGVSYFRCAMYRAPYSH